MRVPENYLAPVLSVDDVVEDVEWLRENFVLFMEFLYSEHPAWGYVSSSTPDDYASVVRKKGLPVFRVGVVRGRVMRLRGVDEVRIIYMVEDGRAIPMFIVGDDGFIAV